MPLNIIHGDLVQHSKAFKFTKVGIAWYLRLLLISTMRLLRVGYILHIRLSASLMLATVR